MLSDESSSDSETGRFKSHSEKKDSKISSYKEDRYKSSSHRRPSERSGYCKDIDRRRTDRSHFSRRSPEKHRSSRPSSNDIRKYSRERSTDLHRRSIERHRHSERAHRARENRSRSRDKKHNPKSRSWKTNDYGKNTKEEMRRNISDEANKRLSHDEKYKSVDKNTPHLELNVSRSEVHKASIDKTIKKIETLTEDVVESDVSDEIKPGSYYNMIPVVKEKSVESSETDSSDDERLRAKLLNLEKKLDKTKKRKHKKKHRKRNTKCKNIDNDGSNTVEVTSTTDILENKDNINIMETEVSSTQLKENKKESSEEGEISSDDEDAQIIVSDIIDIDPTDLRHKLQRTVVKEPSPDLRERLKTRSDVCGPTLPPRLERIKGKSISPDIEGPMLPPHLLKKGKNIG